MSVIVFENANVFDGESRDLLEDVCVIVEDGVIREVGRSRSNAKDWLRVPVKGKTLMPGLIDCHVHIYADSLHFGPPEPPVTYRAQYAQKFLRHICTYGFTSVRDVAGGDHGMAMALKDGLFPGPRFFYGGLCLTQTGGHGDFRPTTAETSYCNCGAERNVLAVHADGVDECIKAAREELRKGASHIKIMASGGVMSTSDPIDRCQYSEAEIRAIVEECDRQGSYVCAHCHPAEAIRRCVEYGVRSIEHGTLIDEDTADFVAANGAFVVPTMAVIFALMEDGKQMGMSDASHAKLVKIHERALGGLEIMKKAGVKMGFGTDLLGQQHTRQGTEFRLRSEVLEPFDILHSATAVSAEILQMKGKLGVIKPDALADIIVINGNPLDDITLMADAPQHLEHVMIDGQFLPR